VNTFTRFERSLMKEEYQKANLTSPIEGLLLIRKKAAEMGDQLINMHIMADQTPPASVRIAAAAQALKGGYIKNIFPLRDKISKFYKKYRNVQYNPENEILMTVGSQLGLDCAFKLLVEPEDEIILFEPDYAPYKPMIRFYGGQPLSIPLILKNNKWFFDKDNFSSKISKKTKMVILSNPNNPVGYIYRKDDLDFIVDLVQKNDCWLISDEVWSLLLENKKIPYISIATYKKIKDRLVTVFSASKTFGMSGYRTGAILGPSEFIVAIGQMVRFSGHHAPTVGQIAFLEAMKNYEDMKPWINNRISEIKKRVNYVVSNLEKFKKIKCAVPESGVFLFPSIQEYGMSSLDFCLRLMREEKVFVLPGYFYGKRSDGFIRMSLSLPEEDFKEGIQRFFNFIKKLELM